MISGFRECPVSTPSSPGRPSSRTRFSRCAQLRLPTNWRRNARGAARQLRDNSTTSRTASSEGARLTRYCGDKFGWTLLMTVVQAGGQPAAQGLEIPRSADERPYPDEAERAARCFTRWTTCSATCSTTPRGMGRRSSSCRTTGPRQPGRQGPAQLALHGGLPRLRSSWSRPARAAGTVARFNQGPGRPLRAGQPRHRA